MSRQLLEYVTIFAGCLRYIAGDAYGWDDLETGGGLYGLWSHASRAVIMLATPSGQACNERTHFSIDPEYVTRINRYLQKHYGIQYIGNWHSHHGLKMDHPSSGDVDQIHGVAARHSIPRMVQIVITREDNSLSRPRSIRSGNNICALMRINAFAYPDAARGSYERCALRKLPGQSPIRMALAKSDIIQVPGRPRHVSFPLDRILCDEVDSYDTQSPGQTVPAVLLEQIHSLPDYIADQIEIFSNDGLVIVSVPLSEEERLCVAYQANTRRPRVHSAYLVYPRTQTSQDVTERALLNDCHTPLNQIINRMGQSWRP